MKSSLFFVFITMFFASVSLAQVGINTCGTQADPSAGLDVNYTDKGFLLPRMTSNQMRMIENPATGLIVFNLDSLDLFIFTGKNWMPVSSGLQDIMDDPFSCGSPMTVQHVGGNVAPVSKTVTYNTASNINGEPSKCWITSNLGSERWAMAANEASEAAAGWYWQFNKKQGYKHDEFTRTPSTTWVNSMNETSDWSPEEDPCVLLLGIGWRIPTSTEWNNIDVAGPWNNYYQTYNSPLRLHGAGRLLKADGSIDSRGLIASYWSSTNYDDSKGKNIYATSSNSFLSVADKAYGMPLRCISCIKPKAPSERNHIAFSNQITWAWGLVSEATGYKWNQVNDYTSATDVGADTVITETGLSPCSGYTRYVWAYSECGNSSPLVVTESTLNCPCGYFVKVTHIADTVAPVDLVVDYPTIKDVPGEEAKCWLAINLGATTIPSGISDTNQAIYGWYWQFNRTQGFKHDGTTRTPNTTWVTNISENSNWLPEHDPCTIEIGEDWRIPTQTEWINVDNAGNWTSYLQVYQSPLRLIRAGRLHNTNGSLVTRNQYGAYWSSLHQASANNNAYQLFFNSNSCSVITIEKAFGSSLRCISCRNFIPECSDHLNYSTRIIWNWTPVTTASGYKWNFIDDYGTAEDLGTVVSKDETGLLPDSIYVRYVWSYNDCGNSEPLTLTIATTSFACGDSLYVNHLAGNTAPVDKNTVYGTVTNIPGETSKCWISSNLGADRQADSVNEPSELPAGWYWQFGHKQGYKHDGTSRTPPSAWITEIAFGAEWPESEDPCRLELGAEWRIPTYTEWYNVDNIGGWTNWTGPWNSQLKLNTAGYLNQSDGTLVQRGVSHYSWSSSHNTAWSGHAMFFSFTSSFIAIGMNDSGFNLRCLRE